MQSGYKMCDGASFHSLYDSAMNSNCYADAAKVTGVAPGTNVVVGPTHVPAVVSPGSVVGDGVGSAIGGAVAGPIGAAVGGAIGTAVGRSVDQAVVNVVTGRRLLARATVGDLLP